VRSKSYARKPRLLQRTDGALFLAAVVAIRLSLPPQNWPWHLLLPLLAYYVIVAVELRLRSTAPRLAVGRVGGLPVVAAIAFGLATVVALLLYQELACPEVADLAAHLPSGMFGNL
jgi:hypothetical protein